MEQHDKMLSPEEQYAQLAPTLDADGFSLYAAAEEVAGLKVYEEFPYEDNRGMFEMADGHTLLRYLEAAYFGTVTWEIVPGTPYERAILGEVDKTMPEYRAFYQKICAGAAAHIKKRIGKEMKNVNEPITEINKESFWDLIHEAKNACGQDMDAMLAYLKDRLVSMGPAQAQNFHDIIHAYEDLADKYGLWDAAGIMKEYGCSDDGFIDFRAWLIAQGREVYFAALADPDSLADVIPYGDCRFEQLSYVGDYAYEQLTGKSAYDQTDRSAYEALLINRQSLKNLIGIMYSKEDILFKALQVNESRASRWCQKVREPMLKQARRLSSDETRDLTQLENIWYEGDNGSADHYNWTRYYALNLHSVFYRGTVEWRCFNSTLHAGKVAAYVNLCLAISAQAIAQRSTVMRKTHSDNELFTFRVWLVRLGLNGEEFKHTRDHLLANLDGDRAWRFDKDSYAVNKKKKKSREMER